MKFYISKQGNETLRKLKNAETDLELIFLSTKCDEYYIWELEVGEAVRKLFSVRIKRFLKRIKLAFKEF